MTNDMMNVRSLVEKSADADLLLEMIGFAAERLMGELEVGGATGADFGERARCGSPSGTPTVTAIGRRAPEPLNCAFPSCARVAISQAFLPVVRRW